jgi:hypothetical protein
MRRGRFDAILEEYPAGVEPASARHAARRPSSSSSKAREVA